MKISAHCFCFTCSVALELSIQSHSSLVLMTLTTALSVGLLSLSLNRPDCRGSNVADKRQKRGAWDENKALVTSARQKFITLTCTQLLPPPNSLFILELLCFSSAARIYRLHLKKPL